MKEELETPERYMWFSFADNGFKGAVIVKAHGVSDGLMKINLLGINPGGQVMAVDIPEETSSLVTPDMTNRLLSREDIDKYAGGAITLDEFRRRNTAVQ
jgi:hypothetical protein